METPILIEDKNPPKRIKLPKIPNFFQEWKRKRRIKAIGKMRLQIAAKWEEERKKRIRKEYLLSQLHGFSRELYERTGFMVTGMGNDVCTDEYMLRGMFRHTFGKSVDEVFFAQDYNQEEARGEAFRRINNQRPRVTGLPRRPRSRRIRE